MMERRAERLARRTHAGTARGVEILSAHVPFSPLTQHLHSPPAARHITGRRAPGRRGFAMLPHPEIPQAAPEPALWKQGWLDEYPCDMPSSVPYPRIPLGGLLERSARRFPGRPACTLYGRATTFAQ